MCIRDRHSVQVIDVDELLEFVENETDLDDVIYVLEYWFRQGYIVKYGENNTIEYIVLASLQKILDNHPCLTSCETDSSLCGLYGTTKCPFMKGIVYKTCPGC